MRPFEILEPASLSEACSLLSKHGEEAKIIAGGQSMIPMLRQRLITPRYLISIKGLREAEYIKAEKDGISIGALTTHRTIEKSPLIKERFPILAEMEKVLATVPIRNWGTIGGDLCHADPAGDPAPVLIALGARVKAMSTRGVREIPLDEFFVDYYQTVLEHDEIATEIQVPNLGSNTGAAYWKESIRLGDYPMSSVAAVVTIDKAVVRDAKIVLAAVGKTPIRARKAAAVMVGKKLSGEVLEQVGKVVKEEVDPTGDVVASAEYKRELAGIITKKVVSEAAKQAK